jgi:hypothetical protein
VKAEQSLPHFETVKETRNWKLNCNITDINSLTLLEKELYLLYKQTLTLNNLHDLNNSTDLYKYCAPSMSSIIMQGIKIMLSIHAMKKYREKGGIFPLVLNLGAR